MCESRPLLLKHEGGTMAQHVNPLHANFDVDYVIVYRFTDTSMAGVQARVAPLIICRRQSRRNRRVREASQGPSYSWASN